MILATKILLAPLCVVAVSLAGRRWGTAVAGVLGGLPVVAGPILLRNFLIGFYGFAVFCLVLAVALPSLATGAAFSLAVMAALTVQVSVFALRTRLRERDRRRGR